MNIQQFDHSSWLDGYINTQPVCPKDMVDSLDARGCIGQYTLLPSRTIMLQFMHGLDDYILTCSIEAVFE